MELEELYEYYINSIEFLFQKGAEFGQKYPKVASALQIGEHSIGDPDTRKLVESFALFDARINYSIDNEKDNLVNFLLSFVCPELITKTPICTITSFSAERDTVIPKNSLLKIENTEKVQCQFHTVNEVEISSHEIIQIDYTRTNLDPKLQQHGAPAAFILTISLKKKSAMDLYIKHNLASIIMQNIFATSPESDPIIYNYETGEEIGLVKLKEHAKLYQNDIIGHPYGELYDYSILPHSFNFISFHFKESVLDSNVKCVILLEEVLSKNFLYQDLFFLNCTPAINFFQKRSEPVKFSSLKDEVEIVPEILSTESKLHNILQLYAYNPSNGTESKIDKDGNSYFYLLDKNCDKARVFLAQETNKKLGEHMIVFADLLCSNGAQAELIDEGQKLYVENLNQVSAKVILRPNKFKHNQIADKWSTINLLRSHEFRNLNNADFLKDFCKQVMYLYGISEELFISIKYSEDICVLNQAWSSTVVKSLFDITLNDSIPESFILAMIWGKILININKLELLTEVRILSKSGKLLKTIGDKS